MIFIVLFIGCKSKFNSDIVLINPVKASEKAVHLSDFTNEITYIPIDNEILFGGPLRIELSNNEIFVGTNNEGIIRYDRNGIFLNEIGSRGRGPGEYQFTGKFTIDQDNEVIYIYDNHSIIIYNFHGEFINQFSLKDYDDYFNDIYYLNGKIFLIRWISFGYAKYNWLIIDTSGKLLEYQLNHLPQFRTGFGGRGGLVKSRNGLYYWNEFNDTVFFIQETIVEPFMLFDNFKSRKPIADIPPEKNHEYFTPLRISNIGEYFILHYALNRRSVITLIDKKDGSVYKINEGAETSIGNLPGIKNDIDGGVSFHPLFQSVSDNNEYLISWVPALYLIKHTETESFINSTPKYPEKKKELEALAASLDENDNPVLMLVKLKE